jgi:hypothetical protein
MGLLEDSEGTTWQISTFLCPIPLLYFLSQVCHLYLPDQLLTHPDNLLPRKPIYPMTTMYTDDSFITLV